MVLSPHTLNMNKPTPDELLKEINRYPSFAQTPCVLGDAVVFTSQSKFPGIYHPCYIVVYDTYARIANDHTDGRRKKRFKFNDYFDVQDLMENIMHYQSISMSSKYYKGTSGGWSTAKVHKDVYEHEQGKIIATF